MTTSYSRTREEVRNAVLRKLRVLGIDRTAESEEDAIVLEALDLRLKELHRLGNFPWKISGALTDVTITSGVATATPPTDMLYPITMSIRHNDEDLPVDFLDHRAFQEIGTKADTDIPYNVLWYSGVFRFYPVPNQNFTAKLTYQKILDDTAAATAPDVPVSLVRWLKDLVAYDCADDFRVPEGRMVRLEREAQRAERNIRGLIAPRHVDYQPVQAEYL